MKKLTTLLLAAGLVVSSYAGASAGEFIPNAQFINQYTFADGGSSMFGADNDDEHFEALYRLRIGFDYVASETLSGTFLFQVGAYEYGQASSNVESPLANNSLDTALQDDNAFRVRLAYVDWMIPNTDVSVRMGLQPIALPSFAFLSPVLDGRGTGITVAAPINDNISVTGLWVRAASDDQASRTFNGHDDADAFALIADFNFEGFRITPWAMYAMAGHGAPSFGDGNVSTLGADTDAWWIGASFELSMFDPFMFALDAYYSNVDWDKTGADDMDGFYVGAAASYKTSNGTPALKAWYASGNDHDELGQPAVVVGAFNATTIMFEDQVLEGDYSNETAGNVNGTWGVLLEWADFSFVEKLSHTARIAYISGTNDNRTAQAASLAYLVSSDDVIEVNFNSSYEIYKNFVATLELGWLTADFDTRHRVVAKDTDDDIFRSALSFKYTF